MVYCIDYICNLTIQRTFNGFVREKSVVSDNIAEKFPEVKFVESDPELDHAANLFRIRTIEAVSITH